MYCTYVRVHTYIGSLVKELKEYVVLQINKRVVYMIRIHTYVDNKYRDGIMGQKAKHISYTLSARLTLLICIIHMYVRVQIIATSI